MFYPVMCETPEILYIIEDSDTTVTRDPLSMLLISAPCVMRDNQQDQFIVTLYDDVDHWEFGFTSDKRVLR